MKAEKAKFTLILFVFNVTIGCSKKDSIQLSPKGEVNSGAKRRGIYLALFTDPEGDSCFSIYQISWIKMKKVTFWKLKTSLSRNLIYNLQTFLVFWRFCCKFSIKIYFLPTSKHRPAKDSRFPSICLYDCPINRSNLVFRKCLEVRRHFGSGRKGYSELREPIKR